MGAAVIDNRAGRTCRRFRTVVALDYGAPIDKVVAMRDALRAFAVAHPRFLPEKVEVHIIGLGANGVELLVQAYFRVASTSEELACSDLLSREILEQAGRLGIDVALAGPTVHLASPPPPPPPTGSRCATLRNLPATPPPPTASRGADAPHDRPSSFRASSRSCDDPAVIRTRCVTVHESRVTTAKNP